MAPRLSQHVSAASTVNAANAADAAATIQSADAGGSSGSNASMELFERCTSAGVGDSVLVKFKGLNYVLPGQVQSITKNNNGTQMYQVKAETPKNDPSANGVVESFALDDLRKDLKLPPPPSSDAVELDTYLCSCQLKKNDLVLAMTFRGRSTYLPAKVIMDFGDATKYQVEFMHDSSVEPVQRGKMLLMVDGCPMMRDSNRLPIYAIDVPATTQLERRAQELKVAYGLRGIQHERLCRFFALASKTPHFKKFDTFKGQKGDWQKVKDLQEVLKAEYDAKPYDKELTVPVVLNDREHSLRGVLDLVNTNEDTLAYFVYADNGETDPDSVRWNIIDVAGVVANKKAVVLKVKLKDGREPEFATTLENRGSMVWCAHMILRKTHPDMFKWRWDHTGPDGSVHPFDHVTKHLF